MHWYMGYYSTLNKPLLIPCPILVLQPCKPFYKKIIKIALMNFNCKLLTTIGQVRCVGIRAVPYRRFCSKLLSYMVFFKNEIKRQKTHGPSISVVRHYDTNCGVGVQHSLAQAAFGNLSILSRFMPCAQTAGLAVITANTLWVGDGFLASSFSKKLLPMSRTHQTTSQPKIFGVG